jgi:hypothetical protein
MCLTAEVDVAAERPLRLGDERFEGFNHLPPGVDFFHFLFNNERGAELEVEVAVSS